MGYTLTTKFSKGDMAYIKAEARERGLIIGSPVSDIRAKVAHYSATNHLVLYLLEGTIVMPPPGGFWPEVELGTETEVRELAEIFHRRSADYHQVRATQVAP